MLPAPRWRCSEQLVAASAKVQAGAIFMHPDAVVDDTTAADRALVIIRPAAQQHAGPDLFFFVGPVPNPNGP